MTSTTAAGLPPCWKPGPTTFDERREIAAYSFLCFLFTAILLGRSESGICITCCSVFASNTSTVYCCSLEQ